MHQLYYVRLHARCCRLFLRGGTNDSIVNRDNRHQLALSYYHWLSVFKGQTGEESKLLLRAELLAKLGARNTFAP